MGTNKCASQAGMTAYGTRRHLYDPKMQTDKPFDQTTISLQMGTNKGASQVSKGHGGHAKRALTLCVARVADGIFPVVFLVFRKVGFAGKAEESKGPFSRLQSVA